MYVRLVIIFFSLFFLSGCSPQAVNIKQISLYSEHISISPNDQHILFSVYKGNTSSIYIANVDGRNVQPLTFSLNQYQVHPEYSPDGLKILYLMFPNNANVPQSYLYIMNSDGSNPRQLTFGKQHIVEAIFSSDSKMIYLLASSEFTHYSPLVGSRPHGFDLYSIDIDGNNVNKITNFNAYEMESLSINTQGSKLLVRVESYPDKMFCLINLENVNKGSSIQKNDFEAIYRHGYQPKLSHDGKFVFFTAVANPNTDQRFEYEIFVMDVATKAIKQLTKMKGIDQHSFQIFHSQEKLIFIDSYGANYPNLMQMNIDGSNLSRLSLIVPNES